MGKNSGYNQTQKTIDSDLDYSRKRSQEFENFLRSNYKDQSDRGNAMVNDAYSKFGDTYGRYGDMYNKYGDVAASGFADEYKARPFYDQWMKTGGFSENDKAVFRRNALAPTTGFWDSYKQQMQQGNARNRYNVGAGAQSASAARKGAQDITEAGIGAEANLSSQIRNNQLAGAAGETGIANSINQNKLAGMSGQMGATAGQSQVAGQIADLGNNQLNFASKAIDQMLENRQLDANTRNQLIQFKAQLNPKVSGWDRALQIGKMVTGAAMTIFGGPAGVVGR